MTGPLAAGQPLAVSERHEVLLSSSSVLLLASGVLGVWLGVHALRSFLAMLVWNVAEDLPSMEVGLIGFAVYSIGLLGWPAARLLGGSRPALRFGILLAALMVIRQAVPDQHLSPALAFAAWVVWMWWLPAFLQELAQRRGLRLAAPAVLLGLAAQVAVQTALNGLDVPMLTGIWAVASMIALASAFVGSLLLARRAEGGARSEEPGEGKGPSAVWAAFVLWPYLFLQVTLLANLATVQIMADLELATATALIAVSLLAGIAALMWSPGRPARLGLGCLAVVALAAAVWLDVPIVWLLPPVQVALALGLAAAFSREPSGTRGGLYVGAVAGALVLFVLLFLFYSRYGWPPLWPVAAALVVLPALRSVHPPALRDLRPAVAALAVAVAGVGLSLVPLSSEAPYDGPAPRQLRVLNYNIHQGFDYWSLPSMQAVGEVIEAADADLVALQEVARGGNVMGGVDLAAWLRWRFPQYHVVYGPMIGEISGNVILSRYPVVASGWERYPRRQDRVPRGFVWATVSTDGGELLVVSTHFSAYEEYAADRPAQARDLLAFWRGRERTILVGDFNSQPGEEPIGLLLDAGLQDIAAAHGLGEAHTFSSVEPLRRIDYIFGSPDIASSAAWIPASTASDHLPIAAVIQLP